MTLEDQSELKSKIRKVCGCLLNCFNNHHSVVAATTRLQHEEPKGSETSVSKDHYCSSIFLLKWKHFREREMFNICFYCSEYFEAVVDQASGQSLEIEVFDKDQGNDDDFLGRVSLDIFPIAKEGTVDKWFRLEDCETGMELFQLLQCSVLFV